MVYIGKNNRLRVARAVDFGLYLDGDATYPEILLPARYAPANTHTGDILDVFVYLDSEDRIIATTETPLAQVGTFAFLKVVDINRAGAFLDWGLSKDLLLPYHEQTHRPEIGTSYVVYVCADEEPGRPIASMKIRDFLDDTNMNTFQVGQAVSLMNIDKTDLGYQMIIDHTHLGLLHQHETVRALRHGETLQGFIRHIRDDDKIDVCLHLQPSEKTGEVAELILYRLKTGGGFLPLHDKSDPAVIRQTLGVSKGMFKKAVGTLYKNKQIRLAHDGIHLAGPRTM